MAELRVHNTDELCSTATPLAENKLFQYALKFSGDEEKADLQKYLAGNEEHLRQEAQRKQEEKQREHMRWEEAQKRREAEAIERKYDGACFHKKLGEDNRNIYSLKHAAESC